MSAVVGLFALACSLQDVTPLGHVPMSDLHALSFISRDGHGTMIGWADLDGQDDVVVQKTDKGAILLTGLSFKDGGGQTWAELRPIVGSTDYTMEWVMYDQPAKDGRMSVVIWSKGQCQQLETEAGDR